MTDKRCGTCERWTRTRRHGGQGGSRYCRLVGSIADRIEAEYMELPKDADGVPCRLGDYVRSCETFGLIKEMLLFKQEKTTRWEIYLTTLDDSVSADSLHHAEPPKPLTKEDIDAKAKTSCQKYWNCEGYGCNECPAKIQGKNPNVYYGVPCCSQAQTIDILRLERERVAGEQATEAWNTRAERTCKMKKARWDDGQCTWGVICSACEEKHEHSFEYSFNFCPTCGAKVV